MTSAIFSTSAGPRKKQEPAIVQKEQHLNDNSQKACKHRNDNGWCMKGRQKCPLLNSQIINH